MTRRLTILFLGVVGLALGLAPAIVSWPPAVIWNASASAPMGLYLVQVIDQPRLGDLVAVQPPPKLAAWLDRRGAAPLGVLLVKRVAALAPSTACWTASGLRVDGAPTARLRRRDRSGRPLPAPIGCRRLAPGEVLLLNDPPGSLDGRYFGPLPIGSVVGRVRPIWITDSARHAS